MASGMSVFAPQPDPKSPLARHRILSPTAGIKVSPLCLGAMNFGDAWADFMGECNKETTFKILDYFHDQGGNFIDTANNYQNEESETWLGEWMEKRGVRDEMVIATKFTTYYKAGSRKENEQGSSFVGNSHKSLHLSLEASLKKLRTSYVDVLYLHWWDFTTSIEEIMQSLNRMVQAGKVLYLGISDTPAWIVSKANQYARDHGLKQFSVYQGLWNAASRDLERDILPMCQAEGMAIAPWRSLGGGQFKNEEQRKSQEGRKMGQASEADIKMSKVLEGIGKNHGVGITSVAMAYVMHAAPDVYPIVGGRNLEHLKGNIEALRLRLSDDEMLEIEKASGFSPGFPLGMIAPGNPTPGRLYANDTFLTRSAAVVDSVKYRQPVLPPYPGIDKI